MTVVQLHGKQGGRGPATSGRKIVAALDIGSTKITCLIGEKVAPKHRSANAEDKSAIKILGVGYQASRGVKAGCIVDVDQAERAIRCAVDAAERMSQQNISSVFVNVSGGRPESECVTGATTLRSGQVTPRDMDDAIANAVVACNPGRRTILHLAPAQYHLDDAKGIATPTGMHGENLSVDLGVVTVEGAHLRNLALAVERAHLAIDGFVIAPYAAGKAVLAEDEIELGSIFIEMGGQTTGLSIFHGGHLLHAEMLPIGGQHITNDIARGLSTSIAHAERMKTLWGSALASSIDDREMLAVPLVGERGVDTVHQVPKSMLTGIIRPRVEEIFEMLRDRLERCRFTPLAGRRVVLSGGASQLNGIREIASQWLDRQIRLGAPVPVSGMPESAKSAAFSVSFGLAAYALAPDHHYAMPRQAAEAMREAQQGYCRRVGRWIADSF
jgi:cell division protein FtsA